MIVNLRQIKDRIEWIGMRPLNFIVKRIEATARQVVAGDQLNREVEIKRVVNIYVTMLALAAVPIVMIYPYYLLHRHFGFVEFVVFAGFAAAGAAGLTVLHKYKNSALSVVAFSGLWLITLTFCAVFSGGIGSPAVPWILSVLVLLSLVNTRQAIFAVIGLEAAALLVLFALTLAELIPANKLSTLEMGLFFLFSCLTAAGFWATIIAIQLVRRRTNDQRLLALANAARAASNAKTEFLSTMTHEMRTPLNSVSGMSEILLMTHLDDRQTRAAKAIQRAGTEILARVENMLEISSLDGEGVQLQHYAFSIGDLVRGVIDALLPDLMAKGLTLDVTVDPELEHFYHADTDRLTRVLKSLLDNAVKFTESGTIAVQVQRVGQDATTDLVRFEVADPGIGIPEQQRENLFHAFQQSDTALAREHEGAGLGLAVSKLIVEVMGSTIHYQSEVGIGSTFWFDLALEPLKPAQYRGKKSASTRTA